MATPGLALIGFMDPNHVEAYLTSACVGAPATPADREALRLQAVQKRGAAVPNAGAPEVKDLPKSATTHLKAVEKSNRFAGTVGNAKWSFKLVEIDPLLAYQFHVELDRSTAACAGLAKNPSMDQLLNTCLPTKAAPFNGNFAQLPSGLMLRSSDPNVRLIDVKGEAGAHETWELRVLLGTSSPLIQVVNWSGRFVVHNGYHRAFGARLAGATHIPCIVTEHTSWQDFIAPNMNVFTEAVLKSADPPTVRHLQDDRAWPVTLTGSDRIIQFNWSELLLPSL